MPLSLAMEEDRVGLLAGRGSAEVTRALVALDLTREVIEEASQWGAQLIVTHHPVFLPDQITEASSEGRVLLALLECGIAHIAMHTNLDAAPGGVSEQLARRAGLAGELTPFGEADAGRSGKLEFPTDLKEYSLQVKTALGCPYITMYDAGKPVRMLAVCGGSGNSLFEDAAAAGCDTFLTGELKYPLQLAAAEYGVNLLICGHFESENIVCPYLAGLLTELGLEARVSSGHSNKLQVIGG